MRLHSVDWLSSKGLYVRIAEEEYDACDLGSCSSCEVETHGRVATGVAVAQRSAVWVNANGGRRARALFGSQFWLHMYDVVGSIILY